MLSIVSFLQLFFSANDPFAEEKEKLQMRIIVLRYKRLDSTAGRRKSQKHHLTRHKAEKNFYYRHRCIEKSLHTVYITTAEPPFEAENNTTPATEMAAAEKLQF